MPRKRPRRILGALAGSMASLTQLIDDALLRPCVMRLHARNRALKILRYRLLYEGSPDEIFIVTYPKSGTTWLQMIVHQLTSDGATEFAHIDEVSPHLEETMLPVGRKISDLPGTPRVVKSHLPYRDIPKGPGRYIYGTRNGLDVAVSYYHHFRKYWPEWQQRPLGEFFGLFMAGNVPYGSWFKHVAGWLRNEDRLNLLVVTYEELSADLEGGVRRIADFCGITIDPAEMPRILERCSFAFMREHEARFSVDRRTPRRPVGTETAFIRQGKVGGWRQELDARSASEFRRACDRRLRGVGDDRFRVLSGRSAGPESPADGRRTEPGGRYTVSTALSSTGAPPSEAESAETSVNRAM